MCNLTSVSAKSIVLTIVIFIVHAVELKIALFQSALQVMNSTSDKFHGRYKVARKVCAHLHCLLQFYCKVDISMKILMIQYTEKQIEDFLNKKNAVTNLTRKVCMVLLTLCV